MVQAIRILALVVLGTWLAWNLYRHLVVYLIRGRVVVLTDRLLGNLVLGLGGIAVVLTPYPADAVVLAIVLAADVALLWAGIWLVVGASPERILSRAGLVLRGMGFSHSATADAGELEEEGGRIHLRLAASPTPRTHLLRVRTARGINKVALFRTNIRKFLLAIPRERR
jgi:hypothetical protein